MPELTTRGPIFRLPPYAVRDVFTTLSQTVDWGLTFSGVPEAWQRARGRGIKVAVLDTGCQIDHPDLEGQVLAARDFTGSRFGAADRQGHGTHCAGIIAAIDNQRGVVGVAPEASLIVAKVLGDDGSGGGDSVAAGILWALSKGSDIFSMSLGSPEPSAEIRAALEQVVAAGKFVICAAGNDGRPNSVGYPAAWDDLAVCVGAIDSDGKLANYSSLGRQVDCAAPGTNVTSTFPGGRYVSMDGTSMATPFVAGAVALLLSACRQNGNCPRSQGELIELIHGTSDDAGIPGPDTGFGWGLIDPRKLLAAVEKPPPAPPSTGGSELKLPGGYAVHTPARAGDLFSFGRSA